jgi:hypothetical protein
LQHAGREIGMLAIFGMGGPEVIVLLVWWAFIVGFVFLVVSLYRSSRRAEQTQARMVEDIRQLREQVAELKKVRD